MVIKTKVLQTLQPFHAEITAAIGMHRKWLICLPKRQYNEILPQGRVSILTQSRMLHST